MSEEVKESVSKSVSKYIDKIEASLDKVRPYLLKDGGNIELVEYEEAHQIVYLKFTGNCDLCPLAIMTFRGGIERLLLAENDFIKRIEATNYIFPKHNMK